MDHVSENVNGGGKDDREEKRETLIGLLISFVRFVGRKFSTEGGSDLR